MSDDREVNIDEKEYNAGGDEKEQNAGGDDVEGHVLQGD